MHKVFLEFSISGVIISDEEEVDFVKKELGDLISAFLKNKNIVDMQNSLSTVSEDEWAEILAPVGDA